MPVPHGRPVGLADRANGVVASRQPTELLELGTGPVEGPTGRRQAQQALGTGADEPVDPEPGAQRVAGGAARRADQIQAGQSDGSGRRQDGSLGVALVACESVARRAGAVRPACFFDRRACRWSVASTARRAIACGGHGGPPGIPETTANTTQPPESITAPDAYGSSAPTPWTSSGRGAPASSAPRAGGGRPGPRPAPSRSRSDRPAPSRYLLLRPGRLDVVLDPQVVLGQQCHEPVESAGRQSQ